jgi:RimJ/RimL family protein N-acetyltransferase
VVYAGIDICEDDAMGHGLGSEALKLWVDYLFTNSNLHNVALETWLFNSRIMHVAEKLGFVLMGPNAKCGNGRVSGWILCIMVSYAVSEMNSNTVGD